MRFSAPQRYASSNRLLLNHAVASAYTDALQSLPREIAENDPSVFYSLWPNIGAASSPVLRDTALAIQRALAAVPLFRCMTNEGVAWRKLGDILLIPAHAEPGLMDPLVADGLELASQSTSAPDLGHRRVSRRDSSIATYSRTLAQQMAPE
jgi:hypothetical protein